MTRYDIHMRKRFLFGKVTLAAAAALLLSCGPATAQSNGHLNHPNLRANAQRAPGPGARAVRPKPLPPGSNVRAQPIVNRNQSTQTTTTTTTTNQNCDHPGAYYDNYNGYRAPVYPGPNAPLPPTGGYYNDPYYYNNGYYNNGYYNNGYYNNGYQNGGYYNNNNGYYNNGYSPGFPPFQGY